VDDGGAGWPGLRDDDPIEHAVIIAVEEDTIVGLQVHANDEQLHVRHHEMLREIAAQRDVKAAGDLSYVRKVVKLDASKVYSMHFVRPASLRGTALRTDTVSTSYCYLVIWFVMKRRPEMVMQTLADSDYCCCSFPANESIVVSIFVFRPRIVYGTGFRGL